MQKSKLDRFIQKYNLGGNVNSVKWKSNSDSLSTRFITPDKSLLGQHEAWTNDEMTRYNWMKMAGLE